MSSNSEKELNIDDNLVLYKIIDGSLVIGMTHNTQNEDGEESTTENEDDDMGFILIVNPYVISLYRSQNGLSYGFSEWFPSDLVERNHNTFPLQPEHIISMAYPSKDLKSAYKKILELQNSETKNDGIKRLDSSENLSTNVDSQLSPVRFDFSNKEEVMDYFRKMTHSSNNRNQMN